MRDEKKKQLQRKGWKVGSTREFLKLTPAELAFIELRIELAAAIRSSRQRSSLTQSDLAKLIGSSQSRVAKMESGDTAVTLDLLFRTMLALGASRRDLARIVSGRAGKTA